MNLVSNRIGVRIEHPQQGVLPMRRHRIMNLRENAILRQIALQRIALRMTHIVNMIDVEITILNQRLDKIITQILMIMRGESPLVLIDMVESCQFDRKECCLNLIQA